MIRNYFIIAWRNLKKNLVFSGINILGLTIGITVCLMIFLFIMNQFSFDQFHKQKDSIYRVMRRFDESKNRVPYLSPPYATALLNDFPGEIKSAVRVMANNGLVSFGTVSFNEKKLYYADENFFQLFSFPLLRGDAAKALADPGSVVLTEKTAKKYFGTEDPMGKVVELDKNYQLKVTGIAKDIPGNSHLDFDLVVPISNFFKEDFFKVWINNNLFTYVKLGDNVKPAELEKKFPAFMQKYMGQQMAKTGVRFDIAITPLSDIYFEPHGDFDNVKHGDKSVVYIFLSIAMLILIIACINFINLSTIRAVERSKEVGLRKVMGALRNHLVGQFIGESILLTGISCLLSLGLLQLLLPLYNSVLGEQLYVNWTSAPIYLFLLGVMLIVGVLAGIYPALALSAFSPIEALKGKLRIGKGGFMFRQGLVVVQFVISVFLIIGTIIIMNQMSYVRNKSLGYDQDQTVLVRLDNNDIYNGRVRFKNQLENNGLVSSVSLMSGEPGGFFDTYTFEVEGQQDVWKPRTVFSDFEYVKTLGLKIIAGRDFSPQFATDSTDAVLLNKSAAASLGFTPEQAIGKWLRNNFRDTTRRKVVGVVDDFNFLSLKEKMDALVITPGDDNRVVAIKLKAGNIPGALSTIRKEYAAVAASYPLEYSFLDQKFGELYRNDLRQQKILTCFSVLAIFIACLGLFGLASFTANKRLKEIGVRKVLGSSAQNIVLLLSRDLLKPVLIATIIAIPLAYYMMNQWLQGFAYRTPLAWWIFALAAFITFLIAFVTISVKALKAALMNPIKNMRTE